MGMLIRHGKATRSRAGFHNIWPRAGNICRRRGVHVFLFGTNGRETKGMSMHHQSVFTLSVLGLAGLSAFAVACSSSSSSGTSNTQVTSLSGTRLLKDLSLTELQQLVCHDSGAYMESQMGATMKSGGCALTAGTMVAMGSSASDCQSLYNQCMSSNGTTTGTTTCSVTTTAPATCTATVADYSACMADETAELKTTYQQLANLGSQLCTNPDAGTTGTTTTTTPASCQKFQSLCPGMTMPGSATP